MPSPSQTERPRTDARTVEVDSLAVGWEWALEAASRAIDLGRAEHLGDRVVDSERELLARERQDVTGLLERLAASRGQTSDGWLPARAVAPHLLGLPVGTKAVVIDLDGVLTDSNALHAAAWANALDPVLLRASHDLGWAFVPFDGDDEYRLYLDGRPRLEGVRLFLANRGLRLTDRDVDGIARHKATLVERRLRRRQLVALPGARRYLQAAACARLGRAVVSASASTLSMLELARIDHLVDVVIDSDALRARGLRSRPAPDPLVAACADLRVHPTDAVSLTHSGAGVVAAVHAGLGVQGIGAGGQAERLRGLGAERVAPSLLALLDLSIRPRRA